MQHRPGFFRPWVQGVGSILENICKIQCCAGLRHNSFPPACQGFGYHEYISNTVADIHGICFFRMARFTGDAGFLYKLFVRFIYTDHRTEGAYGRWCTSSTSSIFATNSASASGMHHSFTSHGLISFFHDLADGGVRNVIDHVQANQLIRDCLHGPARCSFRRFRTGYGTYPCLHIAGYLAAAVFLRFPP